LREIFEGSGEFRVLSLRCKFLGPEQSQIEVAATVVDLTESASRCLVLVQVPRGGPVQCVRENLRAGVTGRSTQVIKTRGQCEVFAQAVPAKVVFFEQLLHVLGRRPAGPRLE